LQKCLAIKVNQIEAANLRMSGKTDRQIVRELIMACAVGENRTCISKEEGQWQTKIDEILTVYLQILPQTMDEQAKTPEFFIHEGVLELLNLLEKDQRIALGLLTGNLELGARMKLKPFNLNRFFPIGAYGCDSASRLDLPAIAYKRAQDYYQVNLSPTQIIIIGDAENDILCAKHYGAVSLAVNTGSTTWEELSNHKPDYLFSSLKNTSQILQAIMAETKAGRVFSQR